MTFRDNEERQQMVKPMRARAQKNAGRIAGIAGVASLAMAGSLLMAPAAHAAEATYSPGVGNDHGAEFNEKNGTSYDWSGDQAFLGAFAGSDGTTAYCIDGPADYPWMDAGTTYGAPYPVENFTNTNGEQIGADKTDQIAWLLNEYGGSTDPATATALPLLLWQTVDGELPGASGYTGWVLDQDQGVKAAYATLEAAMQNEAYRASDIDAVIDSNGDGTGTVTFDATIDYVNGGEKAAAAGEFAGDATLTNATFEGGATSQAVENGTAYPITFVGNTAAEVEATVEAEFAGLVADYEMMIADPTNKTNPATGEDYQRVILADMIPKSVHASATSEGVVLDNPAEIEVQTQISDFVVSESDLPVTLTDNATVSVRATDLNSNGDWPLDPSGNPVAVDVELSLYKAPDNVPFEQSSEIPEGAELIGTDTITGVTAPGEYVSPAGVEITEPGRYVFVERIPEVRLDYGQGEVTKVPSFNGDYGIALESSYVPHSPEISTEVLTKNPLEGETVADVLTVSEFAPGAGSIDVQVHAVGPFVEGEELPELTPENLDEYVVETQTVTIDANGEFTTPEFSDATRIETVDGETASTYYFVLTSEGNAPENVADVANPASFIPAFDDLEYHESEKYMVTSPTTPVEAPSGSSLAQTGADGWWVGLAALAAALATAGGGLLVLQRRRVAASE